VLGLWAANTTQQVGPGTGLAPFRSFILHRLVAAGKLPHSGVRAGSDSSTSLGEACGEMVLFFGCRRPDQVSEWVGARVRVRVASPCLRAWHEAARPHARCQGSTTTAGMSPLPGARIFVLTARKRAAPRAPAPTLKCTRKAPAPRAGLPVRPGPGGLGRSGPHHPAHRLLPRTGERTVRQGKAGRDRDGGWGAHGACGTGCCA
jgi:hypothetical protein